MGSAARMDYTLMGDNVNLGSRLEGTTKFYKVGIIISEFTYQYVKENVIARELDLIRVKGKALPVKIYELLGIKD
jgi:adenylate cyclase